MQVPIPMRPGLLANGTALQATGRHRSANLMRFHGGRTGPVGGWRRRSSAQTALNGVCRSVLTWADNTGGRWIALGTQRHIYAMTSGSLVSDITPIRRSVTLAAAPITTNSTVTILVQDVGHGAAVGHTVTLAGALTVGGLTIGQLNAPFTILTVPDADHWTAVVTGAPAGSSTSGGGAAVVAKYQIAPGLADATAKRGFGAGFFGTGVFGVPRPDTGSLTAAGSVSFDTFGQYLVLCPDWDGGCYEWTLSTSAPAAVITNAPTGIGALLVTEEGMLMTFKGRSCIWSDAHDNTTWTPGATNQAGDFDLATSGNVQAAVTMRGAHLILTTVDAWAAIYKDQTLVYGFERAGEGCGLVSRLALVGTDTEAAWMAIDGFYAFDGTVRQIPCDVHDYVFGDFNTAQASKVWAEHRAQYAEVTWHYPSGSATEVDRYVTWNYAENHWTYGDMDRTAGIDKGVFRNPILVSTDGYVFDHEVGFNWGGALPFLKTAPIRPPAQLGGMDYLMEVQRVVPDELATGAVRVTLGARILPADAETEYGPHNPANGAISDIIQMGLLTLRWDAVTEGDFAIGDYTFDAIRGDPLL